MKQLLLLSLLVMSGAVQADSRLSVAQLKTLIPGNSVSGFADALGKNYTAYYSPDGRLIQVLEGKLKRQGSWKITDDGHFCTQFPTEKEKCTFIVAADGVHQRIKDDGMVTNTMKVFSKGNVYKY
ncbi:MAG: hypothetical protein AB1831_01505 [Pseudomonadota bacterium]